MSVEKVKGIWYIRNSETHELLAAHKDLEDALDYAVSRELEDL